MTDHTSSAAHLPRLWLQPVTRNNITALPHRIVPGAMEGVSDGIFAAVMNRLQLVDAWITPFIRLTGTKPPRPGILAKRLAVFLSAGKPVIAQLMGTDTALLVATAVRLHALGISGIDLNCACPTRTVVGNGAGGALLGRPDWIHTTLVALRAAVPCPVSVKLRSGLETAAEMADILPAVHAATPDFVILHFRTVREGYRPVHDGLQRFVQARTLLPDCTLLASGDMFSLADAHQVWRIAKVDGVAVARGLMHDPWLLTQLRDACLGDAALPAGPDAKRTFLRHAAAALRSQRIGELLQLAEALFGRNSALFSQLARCTTPAQVLAHLTPVQHTDCN